MTDLNPPDFGTSALRSRALAVLESIPLGGEPSLTVGMLEDDRQQVLHELRVHKVELEMQNEELRRAQLELEASRQRWFELYDLAPVGYCTVSEAGMIEQVNLAATALLGRPRAALAQQRFSQFIHAGDQRTYHLLHSRLVGSGEPQTCELRLASGAAAERWMQVSATAASDAQGTRTLRIVLVDISARKQAEAAEAALRLAEQSQRERSEFLSRVSHEFRTPLNAVLGFSHLLLRSSEAALPTSARRQIQHIHDAGAHLLRMVTDLLDVSRAAAGQLSIQIASVDMNAVVSDSIQDVAGEARTAGVSLSLEAPLDSAMASVCADATRLRQVVQNLLSNAIKYNRAAGQVSVRFTREGQYVGLQVIDGGIGMTPEQLAKLFQPFNRLGRETAGIEGTGLGLVIARDLVHAMGGRLTVRSEVGVGSAFLVELLAADAVPVGPKRETHTSTPASAAVTGRVLCVEDDSANRELLRHIFERRPGIALEIVASGTECLTAARRTWPRLVVIDHGLPDMAGLDVLKVLRQINPHLPLRSLLVSGEASPDAVARARAAGADELLAKPIDTERMLSMVDRLLGAGPATPPR